MNLLENILKEAVKKGSSDSSNTDTISNLTKVLLNTSTGSANSAGNNNTTLDLIMMAMKNKGLQEKLNSWISTGSNQELSETEVESVLGKEMIDDLSQKTKLNSADLLKQLTVVLPIIIDQLTPQGKIEKENTSVLSQGMNLLKGFL